MYNVYIRPLKIEDAQVSFKWRNDPAVWLYTGARPNKEITFQIEDEWIRNVINEKYSKRFAIIVDEVYVGNIQLTEITKDTAEYHIFIGDKNYWGKGIAHLATYQLLHFAKEELSLKNINLTVHEDNKAAIKSYVNSLFIIQLLKKGWLLMSFDLSVVLEPTVSVFVMVYNHEKYLEECLDGILMQQCNFSFNIIVGEDCSTDNSRELLLSYRNKYPGKFKLLLHEKNIGAVENQNAVFAACTGKYIALCEGDDYWTDPLKLQKQVDLLEKNIDCSMCVALHSQLSSTGLAQAKRNEGENGLKLNFPATTGRYFHTTTYLIRTTALQIILKKYSDLIIGDTALRYLLSAEGPFVLLNDYVSVYRITGTGIWTSLTEYDKALAHYEIYSKFRKKHIKSRTSYYLEKEIFYLNSVLTLKKEANIYYKKEYYKLIFLRNKIKYQTKIASIARKLKELIKW